MKMKPGIVYKSDKDRLICAKCASASSGQPIYPISFQTAKAWHVCMGYPMACERGCTVYA